MDVYGFWIRAIIEEIPPNSIFVDFLLAAELSKCYQMLLNGAKKVKTNHRRLLTRAASKHFLNADFMTLFHFYRQN